MMGSPPGSIGRPVDVEIVHSPNYGHVVNATDADNPHVTATCNATPDLNVALRTTHWQDLDRPGPALTPPTVRTASARRPSPAVNKRRPNPVPRRPGTAARVRGAHLARARWGAGLTPRSG